KAAGEYLVLDLDLPAGSADRAEAILKRSEALLREQPGVQHVLAMSENPFDPFGGLPCLVALLSAAQQRKIEREALWRTIRRKFGASDDVTWRLRDLSQPGSFPRCGYPIDLALYGPDLSHVREWTSKLAERLREGKKLTDVWVNPDSEPRPGWFVDIDR